MEVFIHEEYVHKRREQRRRRGRRPAVALQLLQVQASTEKKAAAAGGIRLPPASPGAKLQDSPWDQPPGVAALPSDVSAAESPPAAAAAAISFADHLLGYL